MLASYIKRGAYNTFFYGLSSALNRAISFLFFPYFLSILTLTEFGIWDFYQTFSSLGTTALTACASASLIRFYFLYKDDELKQKQSIGNACLMVLIGMMLFLCTIICLTSLNIITLGHNYLIITLANIFCFSVFAIMISYMRIKEMLVTYLIIFTGQSLLATGLTVVGVHYGFGIKAFFYANLFSLTLFLPCFFYLFATHFSFSWNILKEQLKFSVPLLAYSIIYMSFFSIDRFFIKISVGYEVLGIYSLLWRFGILFQFFSISLIDAWPVVLYNADKEINREQLVARLITYYVMLLVFLGLVALAGSHCLIEWFIPIKYHNLMVYFPVFFLALVVLDIARIFQSGFCLTIKTYYTPILAFAALVFQNGGFLLLNKFSELNLWKILLVNCCTFIFYSCISYYFGSKASNNVIELYRIMPVILTGGCYFILFQFLFILNVPCYYSLLLITTLPFILWLTNMIHPNEKIWFWRKLHELSMRKSSNINPEIINSHAYSDTIHNTKVAIFGPYPPPFGGISVHIQRVKNKLEKQQNKVMIFDTINCCARLLAHAGRISLFLLRVRPSIVYYHTSYSSYGLYEYVPIILISSLLRANVILVDHDRRYLALRSFHFKFFYNFFMRFVSQQVFMGVDTYKSYCDQRIVIKKQSSIETPFLPPEHNEDEILKNYPQDLFVFLNNHTPLISANAFQMILFNNQDLYGFEWCIELVAELQKQLPNIGFVFAIATIGNENMFSYMLKKIKDLNVQNNIYILQGQNEYWPLLKMVDIFVRPTLTDNFGISIAEALYFKKPAIASDVCIRPQNTILFRCGDKKDFFEKIYFLLNKTVDCNANSIVGEANNVFNAKPNSRSC
jgi:glycosyltransferase involved in cell wall biosynthesis/O-antigen/teichoic acid export membrane protein